MKTVLFERKGENRYCIACTRMQNHALEFSQYRLHAHIYLKKKTKKHLCDNSNAQVAEASLGSKFAHLMIKHCGFGTVTSKIEWSDHIFFNSKKRKKTARQKYIFYKKKKWTWKSNRRMMSKGYTYLKLIKLPPATNNWVVTQVRL